MKPIKRKMATVSTAVLLGLSLVACGGDDGDGGSDDKGSDDSKAASVEDFCAATDEPPGADDIEDDDYDAQADALNDWAKDLEETGLPEDAPDDAREGFEIQIDVLKELDSGDLEKAADDDNFLEDEFSLDEQDKVKAFTKYRVETCSGDPSDDASSDDSDESDGSDDGGSGPGVGGTDAPTDIPTDLGTELPEDLQSQLDELEGQLDDLPSQ